MARPLTRCRICIPIVIVKAAFDAKPKGLEQHIEVAGMVRSFKYFNPLPGVNRTFQTTGGGGAVNSNFELFKGFHLIENAFLATAAGDIFSAWVPT